MKKNNKSRYQSFLDTYPRSEDCLHRFLTEVGRTIAKDGPHQRPAGALEAFYDACEKELGVPFMKP